MTLKFTSCSSTAPPCDDVTNCKSSASLATAGRLVYRGLDRGDVGWATAGAACECASHTTHFGQHAVLILISVRAWFENTSKFHNREFATS